MTTRELRERVKQLTPGDRNELEIDEALSFALEELVVPNGLYHATHAVRVAASECEFALSEVTPYLGASSKGEAVDRLLLVQYQRGDSGDITQIANETGQAQFYSSSHGLSDGDTVTIWNTGAAIGTTAGAAEVYYDSTNLTVDLADAPHSANKFDCGQTFDVDAPTDRGVWQIAGSGHQRHELHPVSPSELQRWLSNYGSPASGDVPEGALLLTWALKPPRIDYWNETAQIPSWVLPASYHGLLARHAAIELGAEPMPGYVRQMQALELNASLNVPEQQIRWGRWRWDQGVYSFSMQANPALSIYPLGAT